MNLKSILKTGGFCCHSPFPMATSVAGDSAMNAFSEPRLYNLGQEHLRRSIHTEPYMTLLPLSCYIYKVLSSDILKRKKMT